ncbi:MAG: type II toxin-antitoxin system VapC family toxin [Patescibacteria group bacterium]|nr:type II toxin-antitoxin system VapC family toxin [Patescibacteria group bacterium]
MILLDTHALIWWVDGSEKLSKKAKKAISDSIKNGQICISSMTIWEVAVLSKKGKINFDIDFQKWLQKVTSLSMVKIIDVDMQIAHQSVFLPNYLHSDPIDRIIIATAQILKIPLVTADRRIIKSKIVEVIW